MRPALCRACASLNCPTRSSGTDARRPQARHSMKVTSGLSHPASRRAGSMSRKRCAWWATARRRRLWISVSTARPKTGHKHRTGRHKIMCRNNWLQVPYRFGGVMSFGEKRPQRDQRGPRRVNGSQEPGAKSPPLLGVFGSGRSRRDCSHRG